MLYTNDFNTGSGQFEGGCHPLLTNVCVGWWCVHGELMLKTARHFFSTQQMKNEFCVCHKVLWFLCITANIIFPAFKFRYPKTWITLGFTDGVWYLCGKSNMDEYYLKIVVHLTTLNMCLFDYTIKAEDLVHLVPSWRKKNWWRVWQWWNNSK